MRKKGFTLLEVVLAVTLFGLMIGVILQAYTSIQLGNVKVLDTQKTIEVSENLFERLNDMSMDYVIDTGKYTGLDYAQIQNNENTKIINTGTLWLKQINDNISISIFTGCMSGNCSLYIQSNSTTKGCDVYSKGCIPTSGDGPVNLGKYDEVNVDYLNFEIYPDKQYVNINITTSIPGGETLQSGNGMTLTTTVGFKTYEKYASPYVNIKDAAEMICEDVCSISQISNTGMKQSTINMANNGNNITNDACTLGVYKSNNNSIIFGILDGWFNIYGNHNYDHKDIYTIAKECNSNETTRCRSHCNKNKPGNNPYNCGYIRNTIKSGAYTSFSSSGHDGQSGCQIYNEYVMNFACQSMCEASIFSCIDDYEDPLVKRTGIKINTGEHAGEYLQNPKLYELSDSDNYNNGIWSGENGRKCDAGYIITEEKSNVTVIGIVTWLISRLTSDKIYTCTNTGVLYCDGTYYGDSNNQSAIYISEDEYKYDCVKWTWKSNGQPSNKSGTRYVYSTEPKNVGTSCVCNVDYTYSLNAGGFIESGSCGGLKTIRGEGFGTGYEELDYIAKNADLIYYANGTGFASKKRSNIKNDTGLKSRVGINSVILDTNCSKYENGVCSTSEKFNYKTYKVVGESGMYQDIFTNRSTCGCSNSEYYDCVGNCTCENGAKRTTIYLTGHDVSPAKRRYCLNIIAEDSGYNKGSVDNVDWTGSFEHGYCLVNSGEGCIGGQHTGYNYINFSDMELNSEGLRRRYCGTNDRSGGGYLNGREGMVGNHDSDLTNGENSRYSGYEYFCKKKTDECRIYTDYEITPRWYCENVLDLGNVENHTFSAYTDLFDDKTVLSCHYCEFTGENEPINQAEANDWYCKYYGEEYSRNQSLNKCEKCLLSGTKITYTDNDIKSYICSRDHEGYSFSNNLCRKIIENISIPASINQEICQYAGGTRKKNSCNYNTEAVCRRVGGTPKTFMGSYISCNPSLSEARLKQYYCENYHHATRENNQCIKYDIVELPTIGYSESQIYCESSGGNTWSSEYRICYTSGNGCAQNTTEGLNKTTKVIKQGYCTGSLGFNRDNTYECRKNNANQCIDGNAWTYKPLQSMSVGFKDYEGINKLLTTANKKNACNNILNTARKTGGVTTYDPFRFRRNTNPHIPNYEWDNSTNKCTYCSTYRNAYTGVYGYELGYNQDKTDRKLQELWCKRKHNQDHTYQRDGTGCYTGIFITCDETGIVYNTITLSGTDDFYEEVYCNSGVSNGIWTSMGATNSGSSRSGNICLDTSNGYTTCLHGTNITGTDLDPGLPYYTSYHQLDREMSSISSEGTEIKINEKQLKVKNTGYVFYIGEDSDWLNCLGGKQMTNVYKNYNHTCELSITQQSNNILNMIDGISKQRRTSTVDYSDVPRYLRWTIR